MPKRQQPAEKVTGAKAGAQKAGSKAKTVRADPVGNRGTVSGKLSKQAEKTLRESEWLYRSLIECSSDAIFCVDKNGEYKFVNQLFAATFGKSPDYFMGKTFWDIYPKEHADYRFETTKRVVESGQSESIEVEVPLPDRTLYFYATANPIKDEKGKVTLVMTHAVDITERKRAEQALRESEEKYRLFFKYTGEGIILMNPDGTYRFVNEAYAGLLNRTPGEIIGKTVWDIFPADQAKTRHDLLHRVMSSGRKEYSEIKFVPHSGETRYARSLLEPLYDENGNLLWVFGIISDTTESKKAEGALRESERLYRSLFDNMLNGFAYCRMLFEQGRPTDFIYLAVNDAFEKQTGLKDVTGKKVSEVIPGIYEADPQLIETYGRVSLSGIPETLELYLTSMGMWFSITVYSPAKEHFVAVFDVITERKRREKESTEMRVLLQASMESQKGMIIMAIDRNYRYLFFNSVHKAAMKASYGKDVEIGMNVLDCITSELDRQMAKTNYDRAMAGESHTTLQVYGDLEKVYYESYYNPIINSRSEIVGITAFARDVTDRKRLEEEQQRVQKLESVGVLAGGIAHDFNNILTAIVGNISIARMEAEQGSEIYKTLEQAEKASQRARDLTKQLLTFAKGGAPVTKLASLTELLRDTASFVLRGSNVKCKFSIPGDLWHAEIDASQVSQVIQNLVINAQQAMPTGGTVELSAENIALSATQSLGRGLPLQEGNYVRVAVTDHGDGIAAEHLDKIFDPFFTTKRKGSGLGLATSFSIARQHGGHLSVESEAGAGSTFFLYLPASLDTVRPQTAAKQEFKPAVDARILVMDDEQGIKEVAGSMLRLIGYKDIEFASDGAEAIRLYEKATQAGQPFSLVILDLTIPGGMGGREALQKLLEIDPGVRAIVSSGYHENIVMTKYQDYGFSGMVVKPYTVEQLGKALQDVMG